MAFSSPILKSPLIKVNRRKISSSSFRPINNTASISSTLEETNKILVEIQQQIGIAFGMRNAEEKEKNENLKEERSRERLRLREGALESVKKIGTVVKGAADTILQPVKGIFEKIMDFLKVLGTGFAVNAVFDWLKDENNIKKLEGWFSWIKDNWKWMAAAVGAIALLPVIGTISGILGPLGLLVGLLGKAVPLLVGLLLNPLFLKAMLAIGAGILIYKGGEFLLKKARNLVTGGEDFSNAHSQLDKQFQDAGLIASGPKAGKIKKMRGRGFTYEDPTDPETIALRDKLLRKRKDLFELKDQMNAKIKEKQSNLELIPTPSGRKKQGYVNPNEKARKKVDMEVREDYKSKISNIVEARRMGGPVVAGRPYLVGEGGPEMFTPSFNGNIINNMKTEKIYEMISSKNAGKINFVSMELPPKFMNSGKNTSTEEQQEIPIPTISAVNGSNPYMSITPNVYGIYV